MKTFKTITLVAIAILGFTSCSNDDDATPLLAVESETVSNLHAPQTADYTTNPPTITGNFVKFDFSTGTTTISDTDWDIAFRGTTVLVNGGLPVGLNSEPERTGNAAAYITNSAFDAVTSIEENQFVQDGSNGTAIITGSGNGWYTYNPTTHIISAIPGKVLIFRTADNKYAKIEILSYYQDSDTSMDSQYYTFNYVYQPNDNVTTFE